MLSRDHRSSAQDVEVRLLLLQVWHHVSVSSVCVRQDVATGEHNASTVAGDQTGSGLVGWYPTDVLGVSG